MSAPYIDYAGLSPLFALAGGGMVVLLAGLLRGRFARTQLPPILTFVALGAALGLVLWQWNQRHPIIAGALALDGLTLTLDLVFIAAGMAAVLLSWRAHAPEESGHGEYYAMLLSTIAGMHVLVSARNLVPLFLGLELLSIPLYVLCASEMRRASSLEAGLKYLIVGSVGSATFLYGLAMIYGATGSTAFGGIAHAISGGLASNALLLTGVALALVGLAFKASVAPFHQWTPDVYEGAPSAITAFMIVATKAAAFGALLRLFDVALLGAQLDWQPAMSVLATITIVVGNVGALTQRSLKRLLAYSTVAQSGYVLTGVLVASKLGVQATVFYLGIYVFMNLAAFGVVAIRERETALGDDIEAFRGLGWNRPVMAAAMAVAMVALGGFPATAGFFGKVYLVEAAVDGSYAWLGIVIVIGSVMSLAYYLRVVAVMWMHDRPARTAAERVVESPEGGPAARPVMAGGSPELDEPEERRRQPEAAFVAGLFALASIFFGIIPGPLLSLAGHALHTLNLFT